MLRSYFGQKVKTYQTYVLIQYSGYHLAAVRTSPLKLVDIKLGNIPNLTPIEQSSAHW